MSADAAAPAPSLVDWDAAVATAKRLVKPGPKVTPDEARAVVADLRRLAVEAEDHVRAFTGLVSVGDPGRVMVVDRPGWAAANVQGFQVLLDPVVAKLAARKGAPGPLTRSVGAKVTGAQIGLILSYLAGKILGQYEIFLPEGAGQGRLTLVAPNIVAAEQGMGVDPQDFRLWVCLHEVTHRVQFTAVPWLNRHMLDEVTALSESIETDPDALRERLGQAFGELAKMAKGEGDGAGVLSLLATPEQRAVLDRITGFMSLVEGHAEYVMNAVSPNVIPTQRLIEEKFAQRRRSGNPLDKLLRRLLGLDAKTRQYVNGSSFVRSVVDRVGVSDFNAIWTSPETLPTKAEIAVPADWVARVHGR